VPDAQRVCTLEEAQDAMGIVDRLDGFVEAIGDVRLDRDRALAQFLRQCLDPVLAAGRLNDAVPAGRQLPGRGGGADA
jgi:hypothetical protein